MNSNKILYIEDEQSQRESFSNELRKNGFNVTVAYSGQAGIKKFKTTKYDVLLCDLNMPVMSGIQVLKKIKKIDPGVICIVASAHGTIKTAVKAINLGAYDFIRKPLQIEKFKSSLNRALEERSLKEKIAKYSSGLEKMVSERTEKLNFANKQLSALNKLSNKFSKIRDEKKFLDQVPSLLTNSLDFDRGLLLLLENGKLQLRSFDLLHDTTKLKSVFSSYIKNSNFPIIPPMKKCLKTNKTVFIRDAGSSNYWADKIGKLVDHDLPNSFVLTPIRIKNKPVGLIGGNLQHQQRELDKQDIGRFETFANMVGLTLDGIRSYSVLETTVSDRTRSLRKANAELKIKARQLERTTLDLADGNVNLLSIQEKMEEKNKEMQEVLWNLSQRKNELQALLDSSNSGIIMVNMEGKIVAANRVFSEHFDIDLDDFTHKHIDLFNKKIRIRFKDPKKYDKKIRALLRIKKTNNDHVDHTTIFKNALEVVKPSHRYISIFSSPVTNRDNEIVGRVWSYTDITKEKETDEQIHAIIEVAPVPFIITRIEDGKILFVNKPMADVVGYNMKDLIGRSSPDFYKNPEDREKVLSAIKKDGYLRNFETQILDSNGNAIWMIFSLVTTQIGGEAVIVGALYDISKMKKTLDELAMTNDTLKETQTQLVQSEKMASLGMLVAGVAHEINNPIGALRSMQDTSERAMGKLKDLLKGKNAITDDITRILKVMDESNDVINLGAERVETIVKQLKSFARLDEADLQRADINEGIEQALMLSQHEMKNRIQIIRKYGKIPKIRCYPAKLNQVFLNMLINAHQAMPNEGKLIIKTHVSGKTVIIQFTDTGVGIHKDNIEQIFNPGYTTKGVNVGTGLGLSICYQIIQEHKGEIRVKSEIGKGTTFKIILPTNMKK